MVTPKSKTRSQENTKSNILVVLVAVSVFATLISIFGPTYYLIDHHAANKAVDPRISVNAPVNSVEVVDLDHEKQFQATIKSCLPSKNKNCREYIPDPPPGEQKMQRVALISPPGDIASSLLNEVERIVHQRNRQQHKTEPDIEVIQTSHVPPYGYGKTHGLTKIIRLVPQPLVLEVTDALQSLLEAGETHHDISLLDLKAALRQILRFHCRLSHVAAHTAMLSIQFMDLLTDPGEVSQRLRTFLAPNDIPEANEGDDDVIAEFAGDDDQGGLFDAQETYGTQMLTYIQKISKADINKVLDEVLLEEVRKTKNMTAWPCPSFWAAGDDPEPLKLNTLSQRLARELSPDCSDPMSSCFVPRDKCEAAGDGLCRGNKR